MRRAQDRSAERVVASLKRARRRALLVAALASLFAVLITTASAWAAFEQLLPDTIAASTNLTGTLAAIQDDPDSPDASFLTATNPALDTDLRVTFPTPAANPTTGCRTIYRQIPENLERGRAPAR